MTIKRWPDKDPDSNLRYYFDWSAWLDIEDGGVIETFDVSIDDASDGSLEIGDVALGDGAYAGFIMIWLSGGTRDQTYIVRSRVKLTDGTIEDASRSILVTHH